MDLKYGSVCSGIEAAHAAFTPLGWKTSWVSEINPHASMILASRLPEVPNLGDMSAIPNKIETGEVYAPRIIIGGTPCQSFSTAGQRAGMADDRGNLSLVYGDIVSEITKKRQKLGKQDPIFIWENVPGVLSSHSGTKERGRDFGQILAKFAGEPPGSRYPAPGNSDIKRAWGSSGYIDGPQNRLAWRVLDSAGWGVPQSRRRVFIIGCTRSSGLDPRRIIDVESSLGYDTKGIYLGPRCSIRTTTKCNSGNRNARGISIIYEGRGRPLTVAEESRKFGIDPEWVDTPGVPRSKQYECLGNSFVVPVVHWLGDRIEKEIERSEHNAAPR